MRVFILLLVLLSGTLKAQHKPVESLKAELDRARTDSARVMINCSLSKHYMLSDAKKAIKYGEAAEKLATASNFLRGQATALNLLGNAHLNLGEFEKALNLHFEALKVSEQSQDTSIQIVSYTHLGTIHHRINDSKRAVQFYLTASTLAQKINDQKGLSKVYNNVGEIYEEKGEYRQALNFYTKAAKIQEEIRDKRNLAISLYNIGSVYLHLEHSAKGLPYLFKSVKLNEEVQNDVMKMASYGKIAKLYEVTDQSEKALKYAKLCLNMALQLESSKRVAEACEVIQSVYASMGDYEQAYQYLAIYTEHNEILNSESRSRVTSELTTKYEIEQKELENKRLKAEQKNQAIEISHHRNTLIFGGIVTILLLVLLVVLYLSRQRMKAAYTRLQEAHQLMQSQQIEIITRKNELNLQAVTLRQQNEQLVKHNVFKNKIFSVISHDLRAPLSSLKAILNLAQNKTMTEREVKEIFGFLGDNMNVAMKMLDNVLIWAKAQIDESSVEVQHLNLKIMAEENIQLAKPHAVDKDISLINQIEEATIVLADKERLNFVIRNLLMNAIKFSYVGGEVRISVKEQKEEIIISVSDNGKGIPSKNLLKLYSNRRFTTPGTSGEKGTGLGLMLCKEFIDSFHGKFLIESKEGKGSTFSVSLPKAPKAIAKKQELEVA